LFCRALLVCALVLGAGACTKDPVIDQRVVTLYTLEDPPNAITPSSCAVSASAFAQYTAAGDFEPDPNAPPQSNHLLNEMSPVLSEIPASTRQLTLDVVLDPNKWRGYGIIPTNGDIAVSLWPAGHECALKPTVDFRPGATVSPYDDRHVLISGGTGGQPTFIADLSNGSVASPSQDIITPRAFASATTFAGGVVIAGGINGVATTDAEIFNAQSGSFTGNPVSIGVPRANHGATLLSNGSVLLVGGGTSTTALYQSLEVIDPIARHASQAGLASLVDARANPTVLTLTSGDVLVAGGTGSDTNPVGSVEWFSKDAKQNFLKATIPVSASHHESFVALPAGGALGVISQDTSGVTTTWVITSDYKIQQGASLGAVPPGSNVRLFAGANGAPLLWTGTNWFRWSPWTGAFVPFLEATSAGLTLANGPSEIAVTASPDSGLALWLENAGVTTGKVVGLRFDSRGPYSTDAQTLLSSTTTSIAPDRLPGADLSFENAQANGPATGLALGPNAQAVITDANYLNFSLDFDSGELQMPTLILHDANGNDFSIGVDSASSCSFTDNANHLHVERNGGVVSISTNTAAISACANQLPSSDARLGILFRGSSAGSLVQARVRNVVVKRD
jgi:hypothetical protein